MFRKISDCAAVDYGTSDRLMVLFSSKPAMRRDSFDYVSFVKGMPHTKLFLRDGESDFLYHKGIQGLTESMSETVDFLRIFIKRMRNLRASPSWGFRAVPMRRGFWATLSGPTQKRGLTTFTCRPP